MLNFICLKKHVLISDNILKYIFLWIKKNVEVDDNSLRVFHFSSSLRCDVLELVTDFRHLIGICDQECWSKRI